MRLIPGAAIGLAITAWSASALAVDKPAPVTYEVRTVFSTKGIYNPLNPLRPICAGPGGVLIVVGYTATNRTGRDVEAAAVPPPYMVDPDGLHRRVDGNRTDLVDSQYGDVSSQSPTIAPGLGHVFADVFVAPKTLISRPGWKLVLPDRGPPVAVSEIPASTHDPDSRCPD